MFRATDNELSRLTSFAGQVTWNPASIAGGGGASAGTVTEVALTMPAIFAVAGSPITTSGTFAVTADDPGSDKLIFWDDSAGDWVYLTLGTNLTITNTTIDAAGATLADGSYTGVVVSGSGTIITVAVNANLTGPITSVGNATTIADAELAAIAGLTSAADRLPYFTGSGTASLATFTAAARTVVDDATVDDMLTTLGGGAPTGTGVLVRATSPTFVTPALGTPASGVATNLTGTATALNIGGNAATVTVADAAGDTTTFPLLAGSATGSLGPLTDAGLSYNANTNALTATTFIGALTGNASSATVVSDGDKGDITVSSSGTVWTIDSKPFDVVFMLNGAPTASQRLCMVKFARTVVFASGLSPSQGVARTAATAQTDLDIQKNTSSVGTVRWAAAGTAASFIMASQTTFSAGDILEVFAPASPDATLATISVTLAGVR
jgi:hypothetical protein